MNSETRKQIEEIRQQLISSRNKLSKMTFPLSTLEKNKYQIQLAHSHEALNLSISILTDLELNTDEN